MELSMNEKIVKAHDLSVILGEHLNQGLLQVDQEAADMIWGHADGLSAKRLYDLRDGRCSLQAYMDFDPAEAEAELDRDIEEMGLLLDTQAGK